MLVNVGLVAACFAATAVIVAVAIGVVAFKYKIDRGPLVRPTVDFFVWLAVVMQVLAQICKAAGSRLPAAARPLYDILGVFLFEPPTPTPSDCLNLPPLFVDTLIMSFGIALVVAAISFIARKRHNLLDMVVKCVLVVYSAISLRALGLVYCISVRGPQDTETVLLLNPYIACYDSPTHWVPALLAWANLTLISLGFPVVSFFYVKQQLPKMSDNASACASIESFVKGDYVANRFFFRHIDLIQLFGFSVATMVALVSPLVYALVSILLIVAHLILVLVLKPFRPNERWKLVCRVLASCLQLSAVLLNIAAESTYPSMDRAITALSNVSLAVALVFLFTVCYGFCSMLKTIALRSVAFKSILSSHAQHATVATNTNPIFAHADKT
jgi:hypothetical protein